jgi:hypothetical protein
MGLRIPAQCCVCIDGSDRHKPNNRAQSNLHNDFVYFDADERKFD